MPLRMCGLRPSAEWQCSTFEEIDLATLAHLVVRMRLSYRLPLTALDDRDSSLPTKLDALREPLNCHPTQPILQTLVLFQKSVCPVIPPYYLLASELTVSNKAE